MSNGEIILYTTEDGKQTIQLRAIKGTIWLSQGEVATLFDTIPQNITQHIRAIYADGECVQEATCKDSLQVHFRDLTNTLFDLSQSCRCNDAASYKALKFGYFSIC